MKRLNYLVIISMFLSYPLSSQDFDITLTNTESGTQSHLARNSVTLGPGYTYTPSGGSLTVEIQNPIVIGSVSYNSTPVNPETRTLNTSFLVGATNGSFSVNPMGGATYNIPLEMLPGVNGLSPSLSLTYSSNSGPGIAGYGWQIGGLSMITRGPQTYYHDGNAKGIELATTDRFYLDGQRLVPTTGNYGDAGALYQTDNDIYTRVSPQATDSYGPGWFKAETKSGLIFEYGNTNGSKQKINGFNQVVNWYVSKVSDLFGNQLNVAYIQDNYSVLPAEITYGPNTVTFYYKQRTDKISSYLKGAKIEQWLLLDKITIKYNSNVVKTYEFKYTSQGTYYNFNSNLNEIIEYGIGTSRFNSTAITYQIPANVNFQQTMYNTSHSYVTYNYNLITGDYNGDGKADFLIVPKTGTWTNNRVYFGDGNDNFNSSLSESFSLDVSTLLDIRALDLNGDGKDDILLQTGTTSSSTYKYMLYDGTPFTSLVNITSGITTSSSVGLSGKSRRSSSEKQEDDNERRFSNRRSSASALTTGLLYSENKTSSDYNGDGVNDIFYNDTYGNWMIKSFVNSSGVMLTYLTTLGSGTISTLKSEVLSGDFNGDGKSDLWSFEDTGVKIYTFNGSGLSILYNSTWPAKKHFFTLGDFNADGKIDVFLYGYGRNSPPEYDWNEWQIQLSTGTGFEGYSFTKKKNNLKDDLVRSGDFNGDGATDLMVTSRDMSWIGTYFYISKNNGTDFYTHSIPYYPPASHNYYVADYNGDGITDFICTDGLSPWWNGYQVYRTGGNTSILMDKVGNGLGVITKPSYIKLSQASSSVYQRGSGAVHPLADFQGLWTVVSSMLVDNGKGTFNTMNYYYEGAKIHLQGKGFLGYLKSRISDVTASIESENVITNGFNTVYFYPNVQLALSKRLGTNDTIDKSKSTFTHRLLNAITKRIFVYPQVAIQTNILTSHKITITSSYDDNGNPTSIVKTYLNGPTETTTNVYDDEKISPQWLLGRPTSTTLQYTKSGENTITRSGTRVFSPSSNNLTSETWHSGTNQQIVKGFKYNTNGTLKRDSVTANGVYRTNIYTYETDNIRIKTTKDPLLHITANTYDSYGRLFTKADYLSNTLTYTYDDMGREATASSTFGNQTSTYFQLGNANIGSQTCKIFSS